ncbi:hypothetical protein, partial [Coxiella burnetii]
KALYLCISVDRLRAGMRDVFYIVVPSRSLIHSSSLPPCHPAQAGIIQRTRVQRTEGAPGFSPLGNDIG